jgi:hypothetical protein
MWATGDIHVGSSSVPIRINAKSGRTFATTHKCAPQRSQNLNTPLSALQSLGSPLVTDKAAHGITMAVVKAEPDLA